MNGNASQLLRSLLSPQGAEGAEAGTLAFGQVGQRERIAHFPMLWCSRLRLCVCVYVLLRAVVRSCAAIHVVMCGTTRSSFR